MSDFKIIAIRPLKGCNPQYVKILKPGQIYTFYNDYIIDPNEDNVKYISTAPMDLYNLGISNGPKINISAIVGKNGTGKSTLSELLIATINNVSYKYIDNQTKPLDYVEDIHVELFYELSRNGNDKELIRLNVGWSDTKQVVEKDKVIVKSSYYDFDKKQFVNTDLFQNEVLKDFFYTIGVNYSHYALNSRDLGSWINELFHKNDGYQTPIVLNPMRDEGNIDINKENHLVYSRLIANLLKFNEKASKSRNLTEKQEAKGLLFKLNLNKLKYVYSYTPILESNDSVEVDFETFYEKNDRKVLLREIQNIFNKTFSNKKVLYREEVEDYIIKKLVSISLTYSQYHYYFSASTGKFKIGVKKKSFKDFLKVLNKDKSHITFKLRQAINYLCYSLLDKYIKLDNIDNDEYVSIADFINLNSYTRGALIRYKGKIWKVIRDATEGAEFKNKDPHGAKFLKARNLYNLSEEIIIDHAFEESYDEMVSRLLVDGKMVDVDEIEIVNPTYEVSLDHFSHELKGHKSDVIELIPPSVFDYDVLLSTSENNHKKDGKSSINKDGLRTQSKFSELSSGEKQLIHSVSSVLYHLLNLNSVFRGNSDKIKYRNVNIFFDEIELYHHPDMQRKLIKFILESINRQRLDNIDGINICFVSHSPFILSDIPESNILFLKVDENEGVALPLKKNERPKTFGANIHDLLRNGFFMKKGVMGEFAVGKVNESIKILNEVKGSESWDEEEENNIRKLIEMLGEPLLKRSMKKLYYESFCRSNEDIDREIEMLNMLKNSRTKNDSNS